jgi:hypothetical protein
MKNWRLIGNPVFWLILSIFGASSMGFYVAKIWSANQSAQFSDLYAPWWGAHEVFLRSRNPYTPAVAHEIQSVIYGKAAVARYPGDPSELAGGFAYPLFAAFLLWPTVFMSFPMTQLLFLLTSILATVGSLGLWLRGFHFRMPPIQLLTLTLLTMGSFPVLQGLRLQNLSLLAAAFLTISMVLLAAGHPTLAGIFLAVSTFKPQFTIVLILWLALWTVSDWRRRQALAWSFLSSMLLLIAGSEWLLPGWITYFLRVARAYRRYTFGHSLLDVWFTPRGGPYAAAVLLVVVLALCWRFRRQPPDSPGFFLSVGILLAATLVVIPTLAPHAQLLLLPGFLYLHHFRNILWRSMRAGRFALVAAWALLAWPWIATAGLTLVAPLLPLSALRWWELPLYASPLLPLTVLVALACLIRARSWPAELDAGNLTTNSTSVVTSLFSMFTAPRFDRGAPGQFMRAL